MKQYCCVNRLKPECVKAYSEYHRNMYRTEWRTVIASLKNAGISLLNVYIWGDLAIMTIECEDLDESFKYLGKDPAHQHWSKVMDQFFAENPKFDGTQTVYADQIFDLNEQSALICGQTNMKVNFIKDTNKN